MEPRKKAVILLSGGIDSTTTLAIAKQAGYAPYALSAMYGQRHGIEIEFARRVARTIGVAGHSIVEIDLRLFGGSALTADIEVPKNRPLDEVGDEIPVTYVPARNTILLSFALAWAEVLGSTDIFIGVNAVDYSGYPDCRPEYIRAYETMANLATKAAVEGNTLKIHTPLIDLTKDEIIRRGIELGVNYAATISCYSPTLTGVACRECDSCRIRANGFKNAGLDDPTVYALSD